MANLKGAFDINSLDILFSRDCDIHRWPSSRCEAELSFRLCVWRIGRCRKLYREEFFAGIGLLATILCEVMCLDSYRNRADCMVCCVPYMLMRLLAAEIL